ncbi:hypothetical protein GWK08_17380 [Leptobacterium flavescens]|uniref:Uncharacterized protein n=1 Tax=Leptobacterium flavescens TaxID=472055 RepID=A0A6P0URS2_9FLAO|nr:hypothetical protein [Leptobacterium flavescens]NER15232.1 hypothetical protein [Leptobacterium flavescens]
MLLNLSYNDKQIKEKTEVEVGKAFGIKERFKMGGIGSPKIFITDSSTEINNLLILDNNINSGSIELRPGGIILRFRSLLETYGLIIPWYKLVIYKSNASEYTIYRDRYFVKIKGGSRLNVFIKKLLELKADNSPANFDDPQK